MKTNQVTTETKRGISLILVLGMIFSGIALPTAFGDYIPEEVHYAVTIAPKQPVVEPGPDIVMPLPKVGDVDPEQSPLNDFDFLLNDKALYNINYSLKPVEPENFGGEILGSKEQIANSPIVFDAINPRLQMIQLQNSNGEVTIKDLVALRNRTEVPSLREYAELVSRVLKELPERIKQAEDYYLAHHFGDKIDFEPVSDIKPMPEKIEFQKLEVPQHPLGGFSLMMVSEMVVSSEEEKPAPLKEKGRFSQRKNITPWIARTDPSLKKPEIIDENNQRHTASDLIVSKRRPFQGGATIHRTVTRTTR